MTSKVLCCSRSSTALIITASTLVIVFTLRETSFHITSSIGPDSFVSDNTNTTDVVDSQVSYAKNGVNKLTKTFGRDFKKDNGNTVIDVTTASENLSAVYDEHQVFRYVSKIHATHFVPPQNETCEQREPGAYIVGVAKSGTRELLEFLGIHPKIVIRKQNGNYIIAKAYTSSNPLKSYMPCTYSSQIGLPKADTLFLRSELPQRLYKLNSKMKIIAIVREPVSRLISQITFAARQSDLKPHYVNEFIKHNMKDGRVSTAGKVLFFNLSMYDRCLDNYLKVFPRRQIHIVDADEFKSNPVRVFNKVVSFLGLYEFPAEKYFVYNQEKKFYCIRNPDDLQKMACYGSNRGRVKKKPLLPEYKYLLEQLYSPHNERFFSLLGERFNWNYN